MLLSLLSCSPNEPNNAKNLIEKAETSDNFRLNKDNILILIDAGSSGSILNVIRYNGFASKDTTEQKYKGKKIGPGIASMASNKRLVHEHLARMIDDARTNFSQNLSDIPIYLLATAGMRIIGDVAQNRVLAAVKDYIKSQNLDFGDARVISGAEEGLYAWVSANFSQNLPPASQTLGILEVGGASSQLVFSPSTLDPPENILTIEANNRQYNIYNYSYTYTPNSYNDSAGSLIPECSNAMTKPKDLSTYEDCKNKLWKNMTWQIAECLKPCSNWTSAARQPAIPPGEKILGLGLLFNIANDFFHKGEKVSREALDKIGEVVCQEIPDEIARIYPIKKTFAKRSCLQVSYVSALLYGDHKDYLGLGLENKTLVFDRPAPWPLGFVIFHAAAFKIRLNDFSR